jgi:acyl carrier protein
MRGNIVSLPSNGDADDQKALHTVVDSAAKVLFVAPEEVDPDVPLVDQGLDSILAVELLESLNGVFDQQVRAAELNEHPTPRQLAAYYVQLTTDAGGAGATSPYLSVVRECLAEVLMAEVEPATDHTTFADLGMDSILRVEFIAVLNSRLDRSDDEALLREHSTPARFAAYLASQTDGEAGQPPAEAFAVLQKAVLEVLPETSRDTVTPQTSLRQLGVSSLDRADIVAQAMHQLGVRVPAERLAAAQNLGALATLLEQCRERG